MFKRQFDRCTGDLLCELDHHDYIVWTVKVWLNTLFTASYDCSVAHITFNITEQNDFEVIELNRIRGPTQWADAIGVNSNGKLIATHDEDTFQISIWDFNHQESVLCLTGHTDEVHFFGLPFKKIQKSG